MKGYIMLEALEVRKAKNGVIVVVNTEDGQRGICV